MFSRPFAALAGAAWLVAAGPAWAAPVTEEGLVAQALTRVPGLQAAQAAARAQRARMGIPSANYLPQVSLGASYARAANVPPAPFGSTPGDGGVGNVAVHQEIFNFGQTGAAVDVAKGQAESSEAQARGTAVDASFAVRQAYTQWFEARGLEVSAREQLNSASKLLAQAQSFYKHGVRPRIDVSRAEVVLAQAQAGLADARNNVEVAHRTLETAIGDVPVTGEPMLPAEPAIARLSRPDLEALARRVHPALQAGAAQLRVARASTEVAQRSQLPDLSANGIVGARAQELAFGPDWQLGLNLGMPLYTGGSIQSQVQAAREAETAASAQLAENEQQVMLGVDRASIQLSGAREKLTAFRAALASARDNFSLARNRYRDGVGSIIEVSEAQALLAGAEADEVRGEGAVHLAIATLQAATGLTGLEPNPEEGR